MNRVLAVNDLEVRYPSGTLFDRLRGAPREVTVLPGVSLEIRPGQTLGLIGESGSGKTTLGRAVMGLAPISAGTMEVNGIAVTPGSRTAWPKVRRSAALMFQDAHAALDPRMRLVNSVTEALAIDGIDSRQRRERGIELLAQVGLSADFADRFPHQISGGQARRVTVARALALSPRLVIADEPTAGLDLSVQGEILNLLNQLQARSGVSFLLITHNLAVARHVTDRIAILYLGRIVEEGPSEQVFARPAHPYTRALLAARNHDSATLGGEVPSLKARPSGCEFRTRCPLANQFCARQRPDLQRVGPGHSMACHLAGNSASPTLI